MSRKQALDERAKLIKALYALCSKLTEVHGDPTFQGVWTLAHLHFGAYGGPKYQQEFENAKLLLFDIIGKEVRIER